MTMTKQVFSLGCVISPDTPPLMHPGLSLPYPWLERFSGDEIDLLKAKQCHKKGKRGKNNKQLALLIDESNTLNLF